MKYITEIVAISIVIVPIFIQITPIKLNPISWLGKTLMKSTNCRLEEMDKRLQSTDRKIDVNEIKNLRRNILDFSNSCQRGNVHSKERFDQFFQDNEEYHCLLQKHNLKNGRVTRDVEYVTKLYLRLLEENSFSN